MLHCGVRDDVPSAFACSSNDPSSHQAVRQTVRIIGMDAVCLRTGDRATVQFEFISHPEFIKEGMKLLFREGKTKASLLVASVCTVQTLTLRYLRVTGPWGDHTSHPSSNVNPWKL